MWLISAYLAGGEGGADSSGVSAHPHTPELINLLMDIVLLSHDIVSDDVVGLQYHNTCHTNMVRVLAM